jgi:hypothetical protein
LWKKKKNEIGNKKKKKIKIMMIRNKKNKNEQINKENEENRIPTRNKNIQRILIINK